MPPLSTSKQAFHLTCAALLLSACSAVQGYPPSPENSSVVLQRLQPMFDPKAETAYDNATDPNRRRQLRDWIVYSRMRAYDIEFDDFERALFQDSNILSTGSDLALLAINGLAATTGTAQIKSGLSAASAGIVGAQGAINKDLYYQRTLPALLSQMEANRSKLELSIFSGLAKPDAEYPLARAQLDLDALGRAGSVPHAIAGLTQQAVDDNQKTQQRITELRTTSFAEKSTTTATLMKWLFPNGLVDKDGKSVAPDSTRMKALQAWMTKDSDKVLHGVPVMVFVTASDPQMEADRQRALDDKTLDIKVES